MKKIIVCLALISTIGCAAKIESQQDPEQSDDPNTTQEQETQTLDPGDSTFTQRGLSFEVHGSGGSTNDDAYKITFCKMMRNVGTLAIIKMNDNGEHKSTNQDCSGPYSDPGYEYNAQVLGVAAGNSLQTQISVVHLGEFPINERPMTGDTFLATLRESEGELFISTYIEVELVNGSPQTDRGIDIPNDFDELSTEAQFLLENMQSECPESFNSRLDDATLKERIFDGCIPQDDQTEEEDRSDECTDIDPCD